MKKLILFMILSLNIFSGTNSEVIHNAFSKKYPKKKIIEIIQKYSQYNCDMEQEVIKVHGKFFSTKNFTGYIDKFGKPYGDWQTEDGEYKNCFLDNKVILTSGVVYLYEDENISLQQYTENKYKNIALHLKNENRRYDFQCNKKNTKCKIVKEGFIGKAIFRLTEFPYEVQK